MLRGLTSAIFCLNGSANKEADRQLPCLAQQPAVIARIAIAAC